MAAECVNHSATRAGIAECYCVKKMQDPSEYTLLENYSQFLLFHTKILRSCHTFQEISTTLSISAAGKGTL